MRPCKGRMIISPLQGEPKTIARSGGYTPGYFLYPFQGYGIGINRAALVPSRIQAAFRSPSRRRTHSRNESS